MVLSEKSATFRDHALAALGGLEIFERAQGAVDREVPIVDEERTADAIGIKTEIDLIAWRQVAAFRPEIADRYRPGDELAQPLVLGHGFELRIGPRLHQGANES